MLLQLPTREGQLGDRDLVKVLLAEHVPLIRGALAALIEQEPDLTVVAEVDHSD